MRILEEHELKLVSGGNKGKHAFATSVAIGCGTALAAAASGVVVGSVIGPFGNVLGAISGVIIGIGTGVASFYGHQ